MSRKFLRLGLAPSLAGIVAGLIQLPASVAAPPPKAPAARVAPPNPAAEPADRVDASLNGGVKFLLTQQSSVGSISDNPRYHTALTALAAMALASAGHHPADKSPEGFALKRAMHFLLRADRQTADGYFGLADQSTMFGHAVVTLALTQFLQLDLDRETEPALRTRAQAAVTLILRSQGARKDHPTLVGGWRYLPASSDTDLPSTAWQLLALSSGEKAGFKIPPATGPAAAGYLKRLYADGFGLMHYGPKPQPDPRTVGWFTQRMEKTDQKRTNIVTGQVRTVVSRTPVLNTSSGAKSSKLTTCFQCKFATVERTFTNVTDMQIVRDYVPPIYYPPETLLSPPSEPNHYSHLGEGLTGLRLTGQARSPEAVQSASMLLDMLQADPQMKFLANGPWPFHGTYFATLGLTGFNEPHSTAIRIFTERNLVLGQSKDGSWTDNFEGRYIGRVYCTSLAVIALAARYRNLPLYSL